MAEKRLSKRAADLVVEAYRWVVARLERTIFMGIRFVLPGRFLNPHGFLGMLTFIMFVILGVTGALLMFYYKPTLTGAYGSVEAINDAIEYGIVIRNIHYHASNAMVFLALYHMFYNFFAGRYKIRNEIIWITGVVLGVLTVIEAYTGYDLIMNERGVLAINIGASLTNSIPAIGTTLASLLMGSGFSDLVLRFYTFHVFVIPFIMVLLILLHFPRNLILDVPMIALASGAILVVSGLSPIELGTKFNPDVPPGITVPEWYLTGLYAFIRTGIDKFVAGVLLPTIFILIYLIVPLFDRGRELSWTQRPFSSGLGITGLGQIGATTVWGFYVDPDLKLELVQRLIIDPTPYYGLLIAITIVSFGFTYTYSRRLRSRQRVRRPTVSKKYAIDPGGHLIIAVVVALVGLQALVGGMALHAYATGLKDLAMLELGAALIAFAVLIHVLRSSLERRPQPR